MVRFFSGVVVLMLILSSCEQSTTEKTPLSLLKDSAKFTTIKWQDSSIDFGTKKMGDIVNIIFHCTNTGNKPLYLIKVTPGCGCTLVDYTKQPIEPSEQGKVEAQFDTNKSHPGSVHKNVFVSSNTFNPSPYLKFSGTIVPADSSSK